LRVEQVIQKVSQNRVEKVSNGEHRLNAGRSGSEYVNQASSMRVVKTRFAATIVALWLAVCASASQSDFNYLYDYYFPKESEDVRAGYRRAFDKLLFGPPPPSSETKRTTQVYHALRGDDAAFHAFLHNPDWAVNGAPGEECVYETVLLLLRLGDDRFSQLLAREDAKTRKQVGYAIDPQIDWDKHRFAKTRALYSYRYVRASQQRTQSLRQRDR